MNNQTLAQIRAWVTRFQSETCTIYEAGETIQPDGSVNRGMTVAASGVACRLIFAQRSNNAAVNEIGERERMAEEYRISLPYGTTLAVDNEIEVGGIRYQVVRILEDLTNKVDTQAIITRRR